MASFPMKVGNFSCNILILHGVGVFDCKISSTFFILSCFMACGVSPDCLMIVKNAFSLIGQSAVILFISSFSISLFFMFLTSPNLVASYYN